ncbi:14144_t:CDS:2, partial [Funneliformis geosporum]
MTETQEIVYFDWIEKAISEDYIKYYDYAKFVNKKEISNDIKKSVNEIKMQREVDYHENIIKFYGISKLETDKYLLVMEYADGGTLQSYLEESFEKLEWIINHAQNILIHKNNIKLADFGLSQKVNDVSNHSTDVFGVVPYVDPEYLKNISNKNKDQLYFLNPKSDVYSVGVLLWQISSGHRPFYSKNEEYDASLVIEIIKGRREKIIEGTSTEYSELYKACWSDDSNDRPTLQQ